MYMTTALAAITASIALSFSSQVPPQAVTAAATPDTATSTSENTLAVHFSGIETRTGRIMIALFDSEAAFNGGRPVRSLMVAADGIEVTAVVEGIPAGRYAIKSFHDVDGDGKLGSNMFGIPTEPYAFSNNIAGRASWSDASFELVAGGNTHRIAIK